ncbi:amino acid ABC transporter permease [Shouchella clausii]|jgi:aspartate/glutamate/glutamine transport system permease protein|uniref:Glutamine ABC transporter permease n=3 Tax=Shouchella TaxID=2893057 RepID=Q5WJZ4_SHOC1|nr:MULTISPECIES: amino acid ABC transporter permease [Shouchella]MCM3314151.1 amino acid ABC transporter permease [Psychrobacillus sp. MER TA 17]ALA52060.1 Glutamate transport membrane-spanning protein [Shouchella clausii]AST94907.1 glutamine ABC transporter permease [Shouchella clausii]MBU3230491.1 amino acid ABC transporter permease [Shouchella clausii]MBU3262310.1 amino acid ABC transporter permease [Shouchella clausii]
MITILIDYWDAFLSGFLQTLKASTYALVGSFVVGTLIAVMRISTIRVLNWLGTAYVEFFRNIPLLLTVFIFWLGFRLGGFEAGTLGLLIYTSAFIAEAIRAGIQAIPTGQMEAARSSGLTYTQALRFVILPQAIKTVIPPLGNQTLNLVKNSSILAVVGGADLMYQGDIINSMTFSPYAVYGIVALFYLLLTIPLSWGIGYYEKRLAKGGA